MNKINGNITKTITRILDLLKLKNNTNRNNFENY